MTAFEKWLRKNEFKWRITVDGSKQESKVVSVYDLGEWAWQQLPIKNVIEEWETNFKDEGDEVSLFSFCCDAFVRSDKQEDDFAEVFLWQITLACLGEEIIKEKLEELKQ